MRKMIKVVFSILVVGLAFYLFNHIRENGFGWKEEVKLNGGEIILVQRTAKAKDFGEIGGGWWVGK
ncbi:MAG: hypothetical protein RIS44_3103 [Pseudomonadota bacterium]|jgi:hypothetical protein